MRARSSGEDGSVIVHLIDGTYWKIDNHKKRELAARKIRG